MTTEGTAKPRNARRRGHNEGSIYQRDDGRWVAAVDLGYVDGKRKRKPIYGKTRAEVAHKLTTALKAKQDGLPLTGERQTVAAYLTTWLESVRPSVRARTWTRYEQTLRVHALPALGKLPLGKLGPQDLQQLYAARLAAGSAPATVLKLHAILHHALDQAARWGLVLRNVADLVDPPRVPRHEMHTLSAEQAAHFLRTAASERLEALYVLALATGMRQGELLALRWRDVDLEKGVLAVRGSLARHKGEGLVIGETKTGRVRQVALGRTAVDALRRHRAAQNVERLRLGSIWEDADLVFTNELGGPADARNVLRRSFVPLLARAGLDSIRFHDLRHSAATLLLGQGMHPKIVAEMLGHSQIAVTLDLYSHVTPMMHRQAADALDTLLGVR